MLIKKGKKFAGQRDQPQALRLNDISAAPRTTPPKCDMK
jgi:hypothetical protein